MDERVRNGRARSDFSQGSISKAVLRLALPIMLAELVHVLYSLVDRMYLGHIEGIGTAALTGLGVCLPLITLIGAFAKLCGTGGAPLCSIARGEGDPEKAARIQETAFTMLLCLAAALTMLLAVFLKPLLEVMGATEESLPYAASYFRVYLAGTAFTMISLGMNPFINMQGFATTGMGTVLIGTMLNLILDPVFIFALKMDVRGAALATVISQFVSALWVLRFLTGRKAILRLTRLRLDPVHMKGILSLGVTGFTFKMTNSLTQAVVNVTLKAWGGPLATLYIGSMSIINSLREVISLPVSGISDGAGPVMGFNYGAKQWARVRATIRFMLSCAFACNLFGWAVLHLFPAQLAGIFTSDAALLSLCVHCLHIYFGVYFLMTFQSSSQQTFVALNRPKYAVFFSMFRKVVLILPLTLLLPRLGLGAEGVFWAELASQAIGATASFTTMMLTVYRPLLKRERADAEASAA